MPEPKCETWAVGRLAWKLRQNWEQTGMPAGYLALGEKDYLAAAQAAGAWASRQAIVLNFNYNAFSVGLLSRLAAIDSEEPAWLTAAWRKARLGVLPGAPPDNVLPILVNGSQQDGSVKNGSLIYWLRKELQ